MIMNSRGRDAHISEKDPMHSGVKMRREADFFGEQELVLVYVAKRLKEALKLEGLLDSAGLDYLVDPAPYQSGILFRAQRVGAFFYVSPLDEKRSRRVLIEQGYQAYTEP
jgi:hypothetical protein